MIHSISAEKEFMTWLQIKCLLLRGKKTWLTVNLQPETLLSLETGLVFATQCKTLTHSNNCYKFPVTLLTCAPRGRATCPHRRLQGPPTLPWRLAAVGLQSTYLVFFYTSWEAALLCGLSLLWVISVASITALFTHWEQIPRVSFPL